MLMMKAASQPQPKAEGSELAALNKALPAAQPAALQQASTVGTLCAQSVARAASNVAASAALLPLASTRAETWHELLAMQGAVAERYQQLQRGWMQGWAVWLQEFGDLKRANTMSEQLEQQFNLSAQVGAMCKNQLGDLLNLQENIEVSYAYWMNGQVKKLSGEE